MKKSFLGTGGRQNIGYDLNEELWEKSLSEMTTEELELTINHNALRIIRYSNSEWGNDYFDAAQRIADVMKEINERNA